MMSPPTTPFKKKLPAIFWGIQPMTHSAVHSVDETTALGSLGQVLKAGGPCSNQEASGQAPRCWALWGLGLESDSHSP